MPVTWNPGVDYNPPNGQPLGGAASREKLTHLRQVVNEQAEDEGLWFLSTTITEAYLQGALRRLHEIIEGKTSEECAKILICHE